LQPERRGAIRAFFFCRPASGTQAARRPLSLGKERTMADDDVKRVWDLMEKISIAMLTTWTGDKLRARPMDARVRRDEGVVYCLTDVRACKDDEIEKYPKVMLGFADADAMKFVSLSGHAAISNDRAKIKDLWEPTAKAFWDSPDNPNIRLLTITPDSAEFWDSPGKMIAFAEMAFAAATGAKPDLGENRKVAM
jgi:general stress protein 26